MTFKSILAATGLVLVAGVPAYGATVGFELTISPQIGGSQGNNVPTLELTNTSTAADLTSFAMTIGDTTRNFDEIYTITTSAGSSSLTFGDTVQSGTRTDSFEISFTGLGVSQTATWDVDVDIDSSNTIENFATVFFNNGTAPNSIVTVGFSTGDFIDFTLPDGNSPYSYSQSAETSVIPVPAALPLMAGGLGVIGLMGWRRRKAADES